MSTHLKPTRYLTRRTRIPMLFTQRLELVEGTVELLRACMPYCPPVSEEAQGWDRAAARAIADQSSSLGALLHARIPASWPPELLDQKALEWTIRHCEDTTLRGTAGNYYVILREGVTRTLVGLVGYHTQPGSTPDTRVAVIGYGVVNEYQRRGIATEATRALIAELRRRPALERITALTYPDHAASLGVMQKCGMKYVGAGEEQGTVQYEVIGIVGANKP